MNASNSGHGRLPKSYAKLFLATAICYIRSLLMVNKIIIVLSLDSVIKM